MTHHPIEIDHHALPTGAGQLPREVDPGLVFSLLIASLRNASALILDASGRVIWRCNQISRFHGEFGSEDPLGKRLEDMIPGSWARERRELIEESNRTGETRSLYSIWSGMRMVTRVTPVRSGAEAWTLVVVERVTAEQMREGLERDGTGRVSRVVVLGPLDVLTPRELEVLALLGQGMRPKEIASTLNRSVSTVEGHRERIGQKLGVHDRAELLVIAQRAALLLDDADAERATLFGRPRR